MNYTPLDIANWFLCHTDRDSGESLTHLKLQKLVYYAQAWSLTIFNDQLFEEDFQAWTHGPVAYSLFNKFKNYGWDAIPIIEESIDFPDHIEKLLQEVLDVYGKYGAKYLENLTHQEPPWNIARGDIPIEAASNAIISKKSMKEYYSTLQQQEKRRF